MADKCKIGQSYSTKLKKCVTTPRALRISTPFFRIGKSEVLPPSIPTTGFPSFPISVDIQISLLGTIISIRPSRMKWWAVLD